MKKLNILLVITLLITGNIYSMHQRENIAEERLTPIARAGMCLAQMRNDHIFDREFRTEFNETLPENILPLREEVNAQGFMPYVTYMLEFLRQRKEDAEAETLRQLTALHAQIAVNDPEEDLVLPENPNTTPPAKIQPITDENKKPHFLSPKKRNLWILLLISAASTYLWKKHKDSQFDAFIAKVASAKANLPEEIFNELIKEKGKFSNKYLPHWLLKLLDATGIKKDRTEEILLLLNKSSEEVDVMAKDIEQLWQALEEEKREQKNAHKTEAQRLEEQAAKLEAQLLEEERLEKERLEQERLARLEAERLKKERLEQLRLEREREKQAQKEKERLEKERLEKERLARLEAERLKKERLEQLRLEREREEQAQKEKERLEEERIKKERLKEEERRLIIEAERLALEEKERKKQQNKERLAANKPNIRAQNLDDPETEESKQKTNSHETIVRY